MASALLASSNEPYWLERKDFMKNSISNPNPRAGPNLYAGDYAGEQSARFRAVEQEAPPISAAAVSEDSSSFNKKAGGLGRRWKPGGGIGGNYVSFDISTYSKRELRVLKMRLAVELEQVRNLIRRIESRERDIHLSSRSGGLGASGKYFGGEDATSAAVLPFDSSASRTPDLFLASRNPKHPALALGLDKNRSAMMKKCSQILSKLMKKKKSIWFNSPVDAVGMGLHDYFQIIKNPMDLGTVKLKLSKDLYPSPVEFAADIKLTFNNALLYNPQGHEVHKLAGQFLRQFEGLFVPVYHKYEKQRISFKQRERFMLSAASRVPSVKTTARPVALLLPPAAEALPKALQRVRIPPPVSNPALEAPLVPCELPQQHPDVARAAAGKLPKPKAKEPNKRPMSLAEKQKLSEGLQSLPQEKMANLLHIVKKRNVDAMQSEDEIELDLNTLDTDTLWDLDRFLCNCKKMMSKMRRQEAIARSLMPASAGHSVSAPTEAGNGSPMAMAMAIDTAEASPADKGKKGSATAVEEDVDIGDDLPATNYPSLEIEKNTCCDSSSSSSDSDSSSSSDAGTDSSSDGDTDEDDGESTKK